MGRKLKFQKFHGSDNAITIDLLNGYSVLAISGWNTNNKTYNVRLFLSDSSIENLKFIDESECFELCANYKTINPAILKSVSELLDENFFDKYINRYEYELKCFSKGNELIENERLGDKNL